MSVFRKMMIPVPRPHLGTRHLPSPGLAVPLALALSLTACAVVPPDTPVAGRTQVVAPTGDWVDLGGGDAELESASAGGRLLKLPTHVLALRGPKQEWLAVMVVQSNRTGLPGDRQYGLNACPEQRGVHVEDLSAKSPVRIDCLRFKRWADGNGWLAQYQPVLYDYLKGKNGLPATPYAYMSYRYNTEAGAYVSVQALVGRSLIEPVPRGNEEFLAAGQPAIDWGHKLARAVRVSAGMLDGTLSLPAFPMVLNP